MRNKRLMLIAYISFFENFFLFSINNSSPKILSGLKCQANAWFVVWKATPAIIHCQKIRIADLNGFKVQKLRNGTTKMKIGRNTTAFASDIGKLRTLYFKEYRKKVLPNQVCFNTKYLSHSIVT